MYPGSFAMRLTGLNLVLRNSVEFAVLFAVWRLELELLERDSLNHAALIAIVLAAAWMKTAFFGVENIRQLWRASAENMPYYKFLLLMLVNMMQIVISFALDFHLIHRLGADSFAGVGPQLAGPTLVFEFFYYSALNFMFFGYGDITPQTVPAKLLTLTEISLAFVTVIFLLSDFISLKESLGPKPAPQTEPK
jgi:hypothetical protein